MHKKNDNGCEDCRDCGDCDSKNDYPVRLCQVHDVKLALGSPMNTASESEIQRMPSLRAAAT